MRPGLSEAVSLLLVLLACSLLIFQLSPRLPLPPCTPVSLDLDILTGVRLGRWVFKKRLFIQCVCVYVGVRHSLPVEVRGQLWGCDVAPSQRVGPVDRNQVVKLGSKHPHLLSHLAVPWDCLSLLMC